MVIAFHTNLSLRELSKLVYENASYYKLYIFNLADSRDIERDVAKTKKSFFKHHIFTYSYGSDVGSVAIVSQGEKSLPLWLIESNAWVLRIEDK